MNRLFSTAVSPLAGLEDRPALSRKLILLSVPILLRLLLVPFLQDFEADAYTRMELSAEIAEAIAQHRSVLSALYRPLWPPFWHILCALVELCWRDAYYVPKVLSALFGGLTPYLVYALSQRAGYGPRAAWLSWALVSLAPLHIAYSTSGMTEAFYGFWFLLSALLFLRAAPDNLWLLGSAAALLPAALTRFDCWIMLAALVPMALWQRRSTLLVAALSLILLAAGPLLWFALTARMTGHPLAFLPMHGAYVEHFYQTYKFHELFHDRGPLGFLFQMGAIVLTMGIAITAWGVRGAVSASTRGRNPRALAWWLLVSFVYLFVMWIMRRQVGWRRHYLAIGCGLAVFAGAAMLDARRRLVSWVLLFDLLVLGPTSAAFSYVPRRYAQAAEFLSQQPGKMKIYCDEPGVRLMSHLPRDRFVFSAPSGSADTVTAWLRAREVRWVVYVEVDYSPLGELFPWMRERGERAPFALAFDPPSNLRPLQRLYVYELRPPDKTESTPQLTR